MKIDNIILYNFGSYEGETVFDTRTEDGKNIILVGGKNGAGKTTLFTAIRLCLYGYMSMGYKNPNSFYSRAVIKLINNNAKIERPVKAHVKLQVALNNGREIDRYILTRAWVLADSLSELFTVEKNGVILDSEEVTDFGKFLFSLIPPALFNFYFFDGEKIADFFLEEGSNDRIKEAFLTLCGYDIFDIMRKNFKRISSGDRKSSQELDEYLSAKNEALVAQQDYNHFNACLKECNDELSICEADIAALEKEYYQKGGITQEEWDQKLTIMKEEERKRENWNALLRKWANDLIPFLMIRDQVLSVKKQIEIENSNLKFRNFCEVLETPEIKMLLGDHDSVIKDVAFDKFGSDDRIILDLSLEQSALLSVQINQILDFEIERIAKCKRLIKRSLSLTAKARKELDDSNVTTVQAYMQKRAQLFEFKSVLLVQRSEFEQKIMSQEKIVNVAESRLARVQMHLEEEIKKASINNISTRAIVMLDKLQDILYRRQIVKMEGFFREGISALMSKTHFIDDIRFDDSFNAHIYRKEDITIDRLLNILKSNSEEQLITILGEAAILNLKQISGEEKIDRIIDYCNRCTYSTIHLPFEINKASLSNGEKQIFIMALYHSLVQLCNHEIPFIIDTPFARIDSEHRRNISKHFFSKLRGQVFILSTNEEIKSSHIQIMNDRIATTFLLENSDNKRTVVVDNSYFEV